MSIVSIVSELYLTTVNPQPFRILHQLQSTKILYTHLQDRPVFHECRAVYNTE